jgi:hypothetical protein
VYWYYADVYEDLWVPDFGHIRWSRRLDVTTGLFQYQRTNKTTNSESAWGPPDTLGDPAPPGQITAADAPTRLVVATSEEALEAYQWLRTLTGALAGRLLDIRNKVPALQQGAGEHYENVNYLLAKDAESYQKAETAGTDADRTRLVRLGVKLVCDPYPAVLGWAQHTGALAVHQQPLLALARRGSDLGGKLLTALQ